jgi:iron complex outermembrane receptor protein
MPRHIVPASIAVRCILATAASVAAAPLSAQTPETSAVAEIEEVVVTARKREETLQDVPVAVSAFSAESLERMQIGGLADLSVQVPNFGAGRNQTTPNSAQLYVRGVGQDDSTPTNEPGVGVYVDGVFMARTQGALLDLLDFERVEVLRGPQGTLYGRNTSGGAISFVTRKPDLERAGLRGEYTVGKFGRNDLKISGSAPLVEGRLAAKFDVVSLDREGYMTRRSDGRDTNRIDRRAGRLAVRWQATDDVIVDVVADIARDRSGMYAPAPLAVGGPLPGNRTPRFGYYVTDANALDLNEYDGSGYSATVSWDLGALDFKSVTAFRRFDNQFWGDLRGRSATSGGGTDLFRNLKQNQFTQEFQLASAGEERLSWVAGLFYLKEDIDNLDIFLLRHQWAQKSTSYAAYADLTYELTDALSVNAGGRYTKDEKRFSINATGLPGPFSVGGVSKSWDEFTPKLGLSWKSEQGPLLYATWQKGYKAGAFQGFPQRASDVTGQILPPERVAAYEAGVKADWLDRRLRTNFAVFDTDYTDLQIAVFAPNGSFEARSADAKIRGAELEVTARPTSSLSLFATAAWLDGEYTRSTGAATKLNAGLKFTPESSFTAGAEWTHSIGGGEIFVGANASYVDDVFFSTELAPSNSQKGHELVDARIGYAGDDGRWRVTLGGRNLTNVEWAATGTIAGDGSLFPSEPRTWSLSFYIQL